MSDKNIVVKNKKGEEVIITKPQTPQPKIIIEHASKHEKKTNNKKDNDDDK